MINGTVAHDTNGLQFGVDQLVRTTRALTTIFDGYGNSMWRTDDGGVTYQYLPTGELQLSDLVPHPILPGTLLARATDKRGVDALFVSDNAANSWRPVADYVYYDRYAFGHAGDASPPAIWMLEWPVKTGVPDLNNEYDVQLVSSADEFKTPPTVQLVHAIDFLVDWTERFMLVAVFRDNSSSALQLYTSPNLGKTFYTASFPGDLSEQFYTFLDHSEGRVFMHVRSDVDGDFGNVYASDAIGLEYSLSLAQVSVENQQVEFRPMRGMPGIYFANQKRVPNDYSDARVLTMMSIDKGASWKPIVASRVVDEQGRPARCDNTVAPDGLVGCFLSFSVLGKSNTRAQRSIGSFHSTTRAPGFALAVGNVGPWYDRAENDADAHATFLTRDAGATWQRVRNGSYIGEIADQGNVIVLARDSRATDTLVWSIDAGTTWRECQFTTQPLVISNIVSEPTTSGTDVLVFGTMWVGGRPRGVVAYVEFKEYDKQCTAADYEDWRASGDDCLLGERITYKRRKATAQCHAAAQQPPVKSPCECEVSDYECDFCYERVGRGPCARIHNTECPDVLPQPSFCEGNFTRSKGYRRIPGNVCSPPRANYEPELVQCVAPPSSLLGSSTVWIIVGSIIAVILLAVGVVVFQFRRNHRFERWVRSLGLPGIRPPQALSTSIFAEETSAAADDDLLEDQGGY